MPKKRPTKKNVSIKTYLWSQSVGRDEEIRRAQAIRALLRSNEKDGGVDVVFAVHHGSREEIQSVKDWGLEIIDVAVSHPDSDHEPILMPPPPAMPPSFLQGVFWLVLPRKLRDAIMGDAAEAHAQTIQRYGSGFVGRSLAAVDYLKEALFASLSTLRMSAAQWIQLIFRSSS
jgi:hypothetical protein